MGLERAGSVAVARSANQPGGRGSIPASALFFHVGMMNEACDLVTRFHYSRRVPSNIQHVGTFHLGGGLFGTAGDCIAACFLSIPPTRWSEPVLELSRLVREDGCTVPLTLLIRLTLAHAARNGADLVVSFADVSQGHHGGVYQASGWNYHGKRAESMDGVIIDGAFVPGRSSNSLYGTRSPERLASKGVDAEPHYDEGKRLYWRSLNDAGNLKALRLGLKRRPYPKPGRVK